MYKTDNYIYDFQQFTMRRSFGDKIYTGKIIDEAEMDQSNLLEIIVLDQEKRREEKKKKYFW